MKFTENGFTGLKKSRTTLFFKEKMEIRQIKKGERIMKGRRVDKSRKESG